VVGPILVPIIEFLVAHVRAVHPLDGFLLDFGGDELLLEGSLELGLCPVIGQVDC